MAHNCPQCSEPVPASSRFCQACGKPVDKGAAKKVAVKRTARPSSFMLIGGALALILVVGIALVGTKLNAPLPADMATHLHENTIPGVGAMPEWLADASIMVKSEYVWAAAHLNELQYIPCYCGCGPDSPFGHTDNSACYFDRDSDGNIVALDSHGFG